jgi:hypothetical protein
MGERGSKLVCFFNERKERWICAGKEYASGVFCQNSGTTACLIRKMDYETFQEKKYATCMQAFDTRQLLANTTQ